MYRMLEQHNSFECSVFSACGGRLVVGAQSGRVFLVDLSTQSVLHSFGSHSGPVKSLAVSASGLIASGAEDNKCVI